MCWYCEQYGDPEIGDGLWYLNPYNHARNMYKLRMPDEAFKGAEVAREGRQTDISIADLIDAIDEGDQGKYTRVQRALQANMGEGGGGQVVPLEDSDKILELCSPLGLMACHCRKGVRAIEERSELEMTCMGMGVGMLKWERWPENYKGGVNFLNIEEAKEWNHKMDKKGFVHILMLFGAPFIGGFCQCDYTDCYAIRRAVDFGVGPIKSHYVAEVDYDLCNGCGMCAQRCQFGSLKIEITTQKAYIDQFTCFGCGLCETGCSKGAIKLLDRTRIPALAEVWR